MGRPVRHVRPGHYYFITNRCVLGMFLMRPDRECRRIIRGCLARAAEKFGVELVCFVFLSNHFHLIARFPGLNMAEFMCEFQSQIADRLNDYRGRSGTMFPERYDARAILGGQALRDKICYTLNNPVRAGLVREARDWPGVTSMPLHRSGEPLVGRWLNGKTRRKHKRRKAEYSREDAMEEYEVELHVPDVFEGENDEKRRENLRRCVIRDMRRAWAKRTGRRTKPPGVLGAEAVVRQKWWTQAPSPSGRYERRKLCVSSDRDAETDYRSERWAIHEEYQRASERVRAGKTAEFPHGTYPLGCQRCVGSKCPTRDAA